MANKRFVAISWNPHQLVDHDTLTQVNDNMVYLRDNSVDGLYQHTGGGGTTTGIKLMCGRFFVSRRKRDVARVNVSFNRFFTPNSTPIVVTTINSQTQDKVHCTVLGIGRGTPNHLGFTAAINVDYETWKKSQDFIRDMWINWIAMGY